MGSSGPFGPEHTVHGRREKKWLKRLAGAVLALLSSWYFRSAAQGNARIRNVARRLI